MSKVRFCFHGGKVEAIYQDGVLQCLPNATVRRASSIEPAPDGRGFCIHWAPDVAAVLGVSLQVVDDQGCPFLSRSHAERYERMRLDRDYLHRR